MAANALGGATGLNARRIKVASYLKNIYSSKLVQHSHKLNGFRPKGGADASIQDQRSKIGVNIKYNMGKSVGDEYGQEKAVRTDEVHPPYEWPTAISLRDAKPDRARVSVHSCETRGR